MKDFKGLKPLELTRFGPWPCAGDDNLNSDALLRSILPPLVEEFSDGVAIARISGGDGPLLYVNRAFERLTGYARHEVLGKDCRYLQGIERQQPEIGRIAEAVSAAEPIDVTLRNYRKDGSAFWNHLSLRPFAVGGKLLYLGILRDVSATRQTEIALDRAANVDVTTGCLNRQSFMVGAERRFATSPGPVLLVKLDVISFHDINAGYGFDVGDALLMEIGRRLRGTGAALVARIGANEFALAFDLGDESSGPPIVAEVCAALAPDFVVPGASVSLRFAIGYALGHPNGNLISLIRNAGAALHAAKSAPLSGPRRFQRADEEKARNRVQMTRELRASLASDEFIHHFQPQIDLATGQCVGAEALIRWNHPLFGMIPPGRFIDAAERSGVLLDLGERGLAQWKAHDQPASRRASRASSRAE